MKSLGSLMVMKNSESSSSVFTLSSSPPSSQAQPQQQLSQSQPSAATTLHRPALTYLLCQCRCHQPCSGAAAPESPEQSDSSLSKRGGLVLPKSSPINIVHPNPQHRNQQQRRRSPLYASDSVIDENNEFDSSSVRLHHHTQQNHNHHHQQLSLKTSYMRQPQSSSSLSSCDCHRRFLIVSHRQHSRNGK